MLALLLLVIQGPAARTADDIVLGMSAAFTGPSRGLSIELYRGSMAYFEDVNRHGGIQGRRIVIKAYDDQYNPARAIENTVRLIEQDQPLCLFDYMGSPTVTRILPLLERYKDRSIDLFFPFTGAEPPRRPPYKHYVLNLRASYRQETAGLVEHFVAVGRKRIGVFYQIDAYGRSGWDGVRSTLALHDLKMVGEATYRRGTPFAASMKAQVAILRLADPDVIISVGTYEACAAFIRDARDAGWDVPIANVSGVDSENLLTLLMEAGRTRGKNYTQYLLNTEVVPSYNDSSLTGAREYRELMDLYRPAAPANLLTEDYKAPRYSFISLEGFLNAKAFVACLNKVGPDLAKGSLEEQRRRLKTAVESMSHLNLGIGATVSFGPEDHVGLDLVYYVVIADGRFVPLEDWRKWAKP